MSGLVNEPFRSTTRQKDLLLGNMSWQGIFFLVALLETDAIAKSRSLNLSHKLSKITL
jgi:hypothetical protein